MAFCLLGVVALLAVVESALLPRDAGSAVTAPPTAEQPT
jgi:hypothetical protein